MTDPAVWPWIGDDFSPAREDFRPIEHPGIWYVIVRDQAELLGLWMFVPQNAVCWEVHTCLLPSHGVKRGRQAAREMARWIWQNTPCRRIVTNVPRFNRAALLFARAAGMQEFGVNPRSYQKGGELHDQVLLGLSPD
jgi:RimJ/RimL family protein N-acetyltransferase